MKHDPKDQGLRRTNFLSHSSGGSCGTISFSFFSLFLERKEIKVRTNRWCIWGGWEFCILGVERNKRILISGNTLSKRKVGVVVPRKATTFRQLKVKLILQRRDKVWSFCWHVSYHKFFPQLPQLSRWRNTCASTARLHLNPLFTFFPQFLWIFFSPRKCFVYIFYATFFFFFEIKKNKYYKLNYWYLLLNIHVTLAGYWLLAILSGPHFILLNLHVWQ